eukprot:9501948-Pyramimonas_sp.AAC.1
MMMLMMMMTMMMMTMMLMMIVMMGGGRRRGGEEEEEERRRGPPSLQSEDPPPQDGYQKRMGFQMNTLLAQSGLGMQARGGVGPQGFGIQGGIDRTIISRLVGWFPDGATKLCLHGVRRRAGTARLGPSAAPPVGPRAALSTRAAAGSLGPRTQDPGPRKPPSAPPPRVGVAVGRHRRRHALQGPRVGGFLPSRSPGEGPTHGRQKIRAVQRLSERGADLRHREH